METRGSDRIYRKLLPFLRDPGELYLVQSIEGQTLFICAGGKAIKSYPSSTSRYGTGIRENSFKTPPGLHRIVEKIGSGAPSGRIFRDRVDTGQDWDGTPGEDNLILSRILRLEGLEKGINRGPGVDSHERCIYIHGTNREDLVGKPLSHGCLVLTNPAIIDLFGMVREGTLVYIDPLPLMAGKLPCRSFHLVGIFGTGMSALAQYLRFQGMTVTGSDRLLDSEDTLSLRGSLEALDCVVRSQDGSGISSDTDVVCVSTAIEDTNPDICAARNLGLPVVHRSDLMAAAIASRRTIAVAGTSGKSTVTAMIFEFLTACGKSPSLISGAPLRRLEGEGFLGNAWSGASDILVVEADESDGTLIKYFPEVAVILNISKDHKTIDEIGRLFEILVAQSSWSARNADDPILASLATTTDFGKNAAASWRSESDTLLPTSVRIFHNKQEYHLPLPGRHNLENLRAALCVCEHFDCDGKILSRAVRGFQGVARRFSITHTHAGVYVVDDYAHNPAKIAAAVTAARGLSGRIIAVYQPHGFGPTRFLRNDYITTFQRVFRKTDSLYLLPIYYAGGTALKDISSEDLIAGMGRVTFRAEAVSDRNTLLLALKDDAKRGDCVIIMGARDPSLTTLVMKIEGLFGGGRDPAEAAHPLLPLSR